MENAQKILEVCLKSEKACTFKLADEHASEVTAYVEDIRAGLVTLEILGEPERRTVAVDDIDDVLYPVVQQTGDGVYRIVDTGPPC